jgi:hypothetical protein
MKKTPTSRHSHEDNWPLVIYMKDPIHYELLQEEFT